MNEEWFQEMVRAELVKARKQYPALRSEHEAYSVLLEEVEEFREEVRKKPGKRNRTLMLEELVQIAAMAQRTAEDVMGNVNWTREGVSENGV